MRFKNLVIYLILAIYNPLVCATINNYTYSFQYYTTDNGLSHNMVDCLLKDSRGFLWVGTWDGLCRFDGYQFKNYHRHQNNSIDGNFIYALCEDSYGNIWIGTNNGLTVYVYEKDVFIPVSFEKSPLLSNQIVSIFRDKENNIWVGGDQFIKKMVVNKAGQVEEIVDASELDKILIKEDNELNCIYQDNNATMWFGTDNGLFYSTTSVQNIERYMFDPNNSNSLVNNEIYDVYEDSRGTLWIGTQAGISRLNNKLKQFTNYYLYDVDNPIMPHDNVMSFVEDNRGNLIIGTLGGLTILNLKTFEPYIIKDVQFSKYGLNNSFINCLSKDDEGNIWVGTERGGLNRFNTEQKGFDILFNTPGEKNSLNTKIVNSISEDEENLWIGTAGGGLNRYVKEEKKFVFYSSSVQNSTSIPNDFVSALYTDNDKNVWVGTWGDGLGILRKKETDQGIFENYVHDDFNDRSIISSYISCFEEDNHGRLWMGTLHGIDLINQKTMEVKHLTAKWNGVPITAVGCMLFDQFNNMWVGTQKALFKIMPDEAGMIHPDSCEVIRVVNDPKDNKSLSGNYTISFLEDGKGNIWIGTYGDGINKIKKEDVQNNRFIFSHFKEADGLSNNIAYSIVEDANSYIWIGTDNGLSRLNPSRGEFRNYYLSDGLLSNQFYWGASYKNKNGRIYFGSMNGVVSFLPSDVYENIIPLNVSLTGFTMDNEPVLVDSSYYGETVLTKNIESAEQILIPHEVNEFSIKFSALNYTQPEKIYYAYKLEPFDKDWVLSNPAQREATYMNLKPGTYTFRIEVSSNDLIYNNEPHEIQIVVEAPYYSTAFFKIFVFLFVLGVILLFIKYRTVTLKKQNVHLEKMVSVRTNKIEEQNEELRMQTEYLKENNVLLEERQQVIEAQKKEIENHNNKLEELVNVRTSELVKAKDKAEESDGLKTAFLANMSHEIRTPMNAIVGFSSLLNDEDLTNDERAKLISMINSSSESLLHLIDDILDLSMIESNQLKIKYEYCNLNGLLDNVHSAMVLINRNPDLEIRLNNTLREDELLVNSDVYRIKQVLLNLMNNALKFTDNGYIELGVKKNSQIISFFVKDTGRGISSEELEVIFERFRKIEDDKSKLYRGAGLGLSISRRLSELLGGKLRVESNKESGSIFYFDLPLELVKDADAKDLEGNEFLDLANWNGKTILIVEDEYSNYLFLQKALISRNIRTIWAKDGAEAINAVEDYPDEIDLVLMDINMPKVDGIKAFKAIREKNNKIKIVAQTAFARYEDESRIRAIGFDDFIGKPIKLKDLLFIVNKYLA